MSSKDAKQGPSSLSVQLEDFFYPLLVFFRVNVSLGFVQPHPCSLICWFAIQIQNSLFTRRSLIPTIDSVAVITVLALHFASSSDLVFHLTLLCSINNMRVTLYVFARCFRSWIWLCGFQEYVRRSWKLLRALQLLDPAMRDCNECAQLGRWQ